MTLRAVVSPGGESSCSIISFPLESAGRVQSEIKMSQPAILLLLEMRRSLPALPQVLQEAPQYLLQSVS